MRNIIKINYFRHTVAGLIALTIVAGGSSAISSRIKFFGDNSISADDETSDK